MGGALAKPIRGFSRGEAEDGFRGVYHRAGPTGPALGRPDDRLRPDPVALPILRISWRQLFDAARSELCERVGDPDALDLAIRRNLGKRSQHGGTVEQTR